jgi:hypothetical protein
MMSGLVLREFLYSIKKIMIMEIYIVKLSQKIINKLSLESSIIGYFTSLDKAKNSIKDLEKQFSIVLDTTEFRFIQVQLDVNLVQQEDIKIKKTIKVIENATNLKLITPNYKPKIENSLGKKYVFCPKRAKNYLLSKEEEVRQKFLYFLVNECQYSLNLIELEYKITNKEGKMRKADIVVFGKDMKIQIVIECKKGTMELSQKVFDQAKEYNESINAKYIVVVNELFYAIRIFNKDKNYYEVINKMPII